MTPKTLFIALDSINGLPRIVDRRSSTMCEVAVWQQEDRAIALLIDRGDDTTVASVADMLVPFVIAMVLPHAKIHWRNVRWFQRDRAGRIDEMLIASYCSGIHAEIDWVPRPAPVRTWKGFAAIVASDGFRVGQCDIAADDDPEATLCQRDHAASLHACR